MSARRLEVGAGLPSLAVAGSGGGGKKPEVNSKFNVCRFAPRDDMQGMRIIIIPLYWAGIEGYLHKVQVAKLLLVP